MRLHPPEKVEAYTAAGWWGTDTWDSLFLARVAERPDAVAVVDPANRVALTDGEPGRWTWAELADQVERLAAVLLEHGLGADSVVGIQLPNVKELALAYLACSRLGAVACPFPVQYREHELDQLGAVAGLDAFVTAGRFGDRDLAGAALSVLGPRPVLAWGRAPDGAAGLDGLLAAPPAAPARRRLDRHVAGLDRHPADAVTLCWTSGTESVPKGVPRCSNGWVVIGHACAVAPGLTAADVILNPFPMVNMAGLGGIFTPWLLTGARLVQHHPFDLPTYLRDIAAERVTYTLAPPALLTLMLRRPEILAAADVSSLRVVGSGSAPLSGYLIREWKDRYGIEVTNFFGSNEGLPLVSDQLTVPDPDERAAFFPRYGVPGHSWPNPASHGTRVRLVDPVTGEDIEEPGRPGELWVSGPTIFAGYWQGPGRPLSREPFDSAGYYRSGDVFEIATDADGQPRLLRYVDRARDLIVRGGTNISPAEVESLLAGHPAVADVAVVGYPDELLGERACAVVVPAEGQRPELADLVAYLRERQVASYKLPERLLLVDALPRNAVGKVLKRDLRATLARPGVSAP
jgi:acyl-CoA synthetase (AMP-forming)/AMP-acid ligase II